MVRASLQAAGWFCAAMSFVFGFGGFLAVLFFSMFAKV